MYALKCIYNDYNSLDLEKISEICLMDCSRDVVINQIINKLNNAICM